jgi:uncharacterized protein (DUF885 family)
MTEKRTPTAVDRIAEEWVDTLCRLDPDFLIWLGRDGDVTEFADYSPNGHAAYNAAVSSTLAALRSTDVVDDVDRVTKLDLSDDLELALELSESKWHLRDLNNIASPAQGIRDVFDLMPTDGVEAWETISAKLGNVSSALAGYRQTLIEGIRQGFVPARRQIVEVISQAQRNGDPEGFFVEFATNTAPSDLPEALRADLRTAAEAARLAYLEFGAFLRDDLAPASHDHDGVGRDVYGLHSRYFLGATVDLDETYEWGLDELARMKSEQESIAKRIAGGSVADAVAALDNDPARKIHGTDALQAWMQKLSDTAVRELGKEHFDIAEPMRKLECHIAPTKEGGIYYTGPSDDFSRAGRMWWSVPEGVTEFDTWRETTTVYHEGVPGHHLQISQAVYNSAELNTWRRQLAGSSGHAEGWALYAERLMAELGYLDDDGDRFGMLDGQRMRAARVVLDIGVHLGKKRPDGNGLWDSDFAFEFMRDNVLMEDEFVRFEVNRYLGWPGQAPSYKIGQRIWEDLRAESQRREGNDFSLAAWHKRALDIGGTGLDTLRTAVLGDW